MHFVSEMSQGECLFREIYSVGQKGSEIENEGQTM